MSIEAHWQRLGVLALLLLPLSLLFRLIAALRRSLFRLGIFKTQRFSAPVIVVGNITVGGSGKTPLVIWLADHLREQGMRPGLVARGYRGQASTWPQQVRPDSDPASVGDEAVLLAQRSGCPVCVGPDRPEAVRSLLSHTDCNVIISDDGLQHYAMGRDLEIAVVDGQRRFGNGLLLPAGPLREPVSRLRHVDLVVANGEPGAGEFAMKLRSPQVCPLHGDGEPADISRFDGRRVRAIAGIGNPQRFFDMLTRHGLVVESHAFPDHHSYSREELSFADDLPLLMTEKDAVKCRRIINGDAWVVSVQAQPEGAFVHRLNLALEQILSGRSD
jgi:tetraacyldisaccharide 4'-kinase